jgi:hypothetical protein
VLAGTALNSTSSVYFFLGDVMGTLSILLDECPAGRVRCAAVATRPIALCVVRVLSQLWLRTMHVFVCACRSTLVGHSKTLSSRSLRSRITWKSRPTRDQWTRIFMEIMRCRSSQSVQTAPGTGMLRVLPPSRHRCILVSKRLEADFSTPMC